MDLFALLNEVQIEEIQKLSRLINFSTGGFLIIGLTVI